MVEWLPLLIPMFLSFVALWRGHGLIHLVAVAAWLALLFQEDLTGLAFFGPFGMATLHGLACADIKAWRTR